MKLKRAAASKFKNKLENRRYDVSFDGRLRICVLCQHALIARDLRASQRCSWGFRCSAVRRCIVEWLHLDFSSHPRRCEPLRLFSFCIRLVNHAARGLYDAPNVRISFTSCIRHLIFWNWLDLKCETNLRFSKRCNRGLPSYEMLTLRRWVWGPRRHEGICLQFQATLNFRRRRWQFDRNVGTNQKATESQI